MNKILKYVSASLVPLVLTLSSCTKKSGTESNHSLETLTGKPIAVEKLRPTHRPTQHLDDFYVVLENEKGIFYCESICKSIIVNACYMSAQRRAYGLIKTEKEDGGDENVELIGKFDDEKIFQISQYKVGDNKGILK